MYRSLYDYYGRDKGVLQVRAGELFSLIKYHDSNWWKVRSQNGSVGLVPACYMEAVDQQTADPYEIQALLDSIDTSIEVIHDQAASCGGVYSHAQRINLRTLLERRTHLLSSKATTTSAVGSDFNYGSLQTTSFHEEPPAQPRRPAPPLPPQRSKKEGKKRRAAPAVPAVTGAVSEENQPSPSVPAIPQRTDLQPVKVRTGLAVELLELLRINTGLSYDKSCIAVDTLLSHIQDSIPSISDVMAQILKDLAHQKEFRSEDEDALLQSHDGQQLIRILDELTGHKEDSQQRTWAVHEDKEIIHKLLKDLLTILLDADPEICRAVLRMDDFDYINMLVIYFQMEERRTLRQPLVEIFGCICGLQKEMLSQLLCSVLPTELAIDIMNRKDDTVMQCHCALLLTMIFSTGEVVPFTVYDQINQSFVDFVIEAIENASDDDKTDEQLVDTFVPLVLSFNQHFIDAKSNIVMKVLAARRVCKVLSEKVMFLLNREEDPTTMFQYTKSCPDSVVKFLTDIFSSQTTSDFFYTSDMRILIEIVLRQLTDLSPGAELRTEFISLLHQIFLNSDYSEHKHQANELFVCLERISKEEDKESEQDKLIAQEILKTCIKCFN
ncbi:NCK-interacting protein with SH3 domain-like isoform X1 [Montipora foliosa]|uniref:NCK-interacting protein with SH3 domain-like isoform X1 n=1 Tax=Montipora foliosa TaxID=591990 RepID=UPI0035F20DF9